VDDFPSDELAQAAAQGDPEALKAYHQSLKDRVFSRGEHMGTHLGIEIVDVVLDRVTMRMPWSRALRRAGDILHGGAIMALADHVAGCLFNTDPRVAAAAATGLTTDFNASFLRSAEPGEAVVAIGTVLRRGRNITFMQIDVRGETSGVTVATCRTTYLLVPRSRVQKR
jgi:uncharacterized protein (TIGR00369 family)